MALTAPPVDDAANRALCAFVADLLGVAKRSVELRAGGKSRDKVVLVRDASLESVQEVFA